MNSYDCCKTYFQKREAGAIGVECALTALVLILALLSGCGAGPEVKPDSSVLPYEPGRKELSIDVDGVARSYVLYAPSTWDGRSPLPMVFDFHGSTRSPAIEMEASGLTDLADRKFFLAVFPAAMYGFWNVGMDPDKPDDVKFVSRLIDEIGGMVCVDKNRIYAAGFSGGGRMASRLGCALSDRIAAIAPVAGVRYLEPCDSRAVPLVAFHGTKDAVNSYRTGGEGLNKYWGTDGVEDSLKKWAEHNACDPTPAVTPASDEVVKVSYTGCADNAEIILYRVEGGGHAWPGSNAKKQTGETRGDITATELFWDFFVDHPMP